MAGQTSSAYLRTSFEYDGSSQRFERLDLDLKFDDGFVAYLNGTEVARENAADPLSWSSTATQESEGVSDTVDYLSFAALDDQGDFNLLGAADWQNGLLRLTPSAVESNGRGVAARSDEVRFRLFFLGLDGDQCTHAGRVE